MGIIGSNATDSSGSWVAPELILPSAFMRPVYLQPSAWAEHLPFAFWVVEAVRPRVFVELGSHYGTSYFSFCQAVDKLGLGSTCYAVDTWRGDEHAGFYGDEVYDLVSAHNSALYSRFSSLVRSTFNEANSYFEDGSIDLLHIDGLHTLEAVTGDFETWLPKMSERGVVIFHDTNVRERGFGVFKLFSTLKQKYPHFEFTHGHGLGVIAVGAEIDPLMRLFFDQQLQSERQGAVQEFFARLGRSWSQVLGQRKIQDKLDIVNKSLGGATADLEKSQQALKAAQSQVSAKDSEVVQIRRKYNELFESSKREAGQFEERVRLLVEIKSDLKEEVAELRRNIGALPELESQLASSVRELGAVRELLKDCESDLAERDAQVRELEEVQVSTTEELARSTAAIGILEEELKRLEVVRVGETSSFRDQLKLSERNVSDLQLSVSKVNKLLAQKDRELSVVSARAASSGDSVRHAAVVEPAALAVESVLRKQLQDRFNEIALITKVLAQVEAQSSAKHGRISALESELKQRETQHQAACAEIAELQNALALTRAYVDELLTSTSWRLTSPLRWLKEKFH